MPEQVDITALLGEIQVRYSNNTGAVLVHNSSMSLGSFVKGTSFSFYIYVEEISGETFITIPANGITVSLNGSLTSNTVYDTETNVVLPVDIGNPILLKITIDTSVVGNKSVQLNILSNSSVNTNYKHTFFFTITEPVVSNPQIAVIYDGNYVQQNATINVGRIAQESTITESFHISNIAIPTLTVPQNGISITSIGSNETFDSNPSTSGAVNLAFNTISTFTVNLDSSSLGEKSFVVVISSNDPDDNPFLFTVTYYVAKPFNLVVEESSTEITDGQTVSLGSFTERSTINKVISLSNDGIAYGIRVTNIIASGDVLFVNIPALPFVLQPNNANKVQFTSKFNSATVGKKTGTMKIQWEVSA